MANPEFQGRYGFGADVRFRRWGKLEAELGRFGFRVPPLSHRLLELYDRVPWRIRRLISGIVSRRSSRRRLDYDEFVLECHSAENEPFRLLLEHFVPARNSRRTMFRHAFVIEPGYNLHRLPFQELNISSLEGRVLVHPEEEERERRVVFTWLDFVKYETSPPSEAVDAPATKVKCVAWDLDNTLWDGILVESNHVEPRAEAIGLIKALDERGVIQTVVSKNDHDTAWEIVKRLDLDGYFLYPAINWGQKSENLKSIAGKLNIGIDTFAVIDDSPFEREEITQALPQVRVFTDRQIGDLLSLPCFDVPVTETSRKRRSLYQAEMKRNEISASFSGSYEDFLIGCRMEMELFKPESDEQKLRCWELLQRSNQLNLSSRRYSREEFEVLLADDQILSLAISCRDRFGDYGIVGFTTTRLKETPIIQDFVISCRVAQKRVEHTYVKWLAEELRSRGYTELLARLVRTKKNRPICQVFDDLEFQEAGAESESAVWLKLNLFGNGKETRDVIQLRVLGIPSGADRSPPIA